MIDVDDLSLRVGERALLRGVSLRVKPGHVTVLLGANGAGKSTLLRAACGDLTPSGGAIRLNGRALAQWPRRALAQRRAVMLQDASLAFPFPAIEVVLMGRAPHVEGVERRRDRDIARATLACVQAGALEQRLYPTLSGGEKQRVQMARALAQVWERLDDEPRYLLLDEPTSSLDPRHQHVVLEQVRRFAAEGGGALVVLHDLNLAARYADEIVLLEQGSVVACGPVGVALTEANLRQAFGVTMRILSSPELAFPLVYHEGANHDANQPESH